MTFFAEREEIAVLRGHVSQAEIARRLGRHPSTIGRELRRNTGRREPYRATSAQSHAERRARRPKVRKLARCPELAGYVQHIRKLLAARPSVQISFTEADEKLAATYPYQRAYLPIARKLDGTLTDW